VHDGNGTVDGWSDNVVFAPAYKNGNTPFGTWTFYDLVTRVAWFSGKDFRFDIGGVILEPNASSKTVNEIVGSLGFAYNLNPNQHWFNIGYPVVAPFDGKTMQICAGSFAYADTRPAPSPVAMGCDMTSGSSGGPWIINFSGSPGNTNYINGNNSYRYKKFEEEIYSPYFSDAAKDLLAYISPYTRLLTDINIHLPIIYSNQKK
jgi:V8-like Glu-specific endopeptidase